MIIGYGKDGKAVVKVHRAEQKTAMERVYPDIAAWREEKPVKAWPANKKTQPDEGKKETGNVQRKD